MTSFDVIGFGGLNIDKLYRVNKIAAADEEGFVIDFEETCGGSAGNCVVALARLGCKVGFIGKVSKDREGKMLLRQFHKEGVDTHGLIVAEKGRSGMCMGFVDGNGERALYVDPGVNDTLDPAEIDSNYATKAKFLHLTSFIGERPFQTQKELVKSVCPGVQISLDPGEIYARKRVSLSPLVKHASVMMPSRKELRILTSVKDYTIGAETLVHQGPKIVAVKLGQNGCYVTDGKDRCTVEPFRVKVADTTGAGDAFSAGFLYGLLSGRSLYDCGRIGNFVASRCIMRMGARNGLPSLADLREGNLA